MEKLRFRQVHLDFHTSPKIDGIGAEFDKQEWQDTLRAAHVDSITCFSCCHHGWSYHPTKIGKMHPGLKFNLLRAQMDACKEINVNVPVYLTAGINNMVAYEHPEWREINVRGELAGWSSSPLQAGFHKLCFNTPYLDYLCNLIGEAAELFPEADGIFLDIIFQGQCCCRWCLEGMLKDGLDPEKEADRLIYSRKVLMNYYRRTTAAARRHNPKMRIFHNSGNVAMGNTEILQYFSHLELESLPTGGWGYDHYPMSAAYSRNLPLDFLGMTGKFHTTWGEFGGFKHPNALRYECAAMIANGSKCSVGDQLHPCGKLDPSTYGIIGAAYREVEAKEPWCDDVTSAAQIAVYSCAAANGKDGGAESESAADVGASRLLLEAHLPFDFVDARMDLSKYKVLVLPDAVRITPELEVRLQGFLQAGGKLVLSGESGLRSEGDGFALGINCEHDGVNPVAPDYIQAASAFAPDFVTTPFVMYAPSQRIKVKSGQSLGQVFDAYFARSYQHFCSHQHTPYQTAASGYDAGVLLDRILYFAHPVFSLYRGYGAVAVKEYVVKAIRQLLGNDSQVETSLPSQGRVTLMRQSAQQRYVLHLLYANTVLRGGRGIPLPGGAKSPEYPLEIIEELNPLAAVEFSVAVPEKIKQVTLEPQGQMLPFTVDAGRVKAKVDRLLCHQMVVLHY